MHQRRRIRRMVLLLLLLAADVRLIIYVQIVDALGQGHRVAAVLLAGALAVRIGRAKYAIKSMSKCGLITKKHTENCLWQS